MKPKTKIQNLRRFKRLLWRFNVACSNLAFIGASHPEDHGIIKHNYKVARYRILKHYKETMK